MNIKAVFGVSPVFA